ncbi:DUF5818 domain-containing protein [Sphingomonas sp. UYP23]
MSIGSHHDETGWLFDDRGQLCFRRDAGGTWRLDAPDTARRLLGTHVRVTGRRAEFDLLEVAELEAHGVEQTAPRSMP